ncbi:MULTISPECIES: hypothetical protein [Vibrio]|uniref:hypothetical protein n=1 Tax=Vibrio TaxID=662 RepID=UPI00107F9828|nr:hypothetical protein [Vibrio tasmaniensis]
MFKIILPFFLFFPISGYASSEVVDNFSHVGFGYRGANFHQGALKPYLNGKYDNNEDKALGGLYLDLSAQVFSNVFLEGHADFLTRFSSEVDTWQSGGGVIGRFGGAAASSFSCGVINYRADSDYSVSFSEQGGYCKTMVRKQIARHWVLGLSYQHDFLERSRDAVKLKNVFQFGSVFGLVADFEYAKRDAVEIGYQLGVQFSF